MPILLLLANVFGIVPATLFGLCSGTHVFVVVALAGVHVALAIPNVALVVDWRWATGDRGRATGLGLGLELGLGVGRRARA